MAYEPRDAVAGARRVRVVVIVADPHFEQIAEQVERVGRARLAVEEFQERIDGPGGLAVEMQVGSEEAVTAGAHFGGGAFAGASVGLETGGGAAPAGASAGAGGALSGAGVAAGAGADVSAI